MPQKFRDGERMKVKKLNPVLTDPEEAPVTAEAYAERGVVIIAFGSQEFELTASEAADLCAQIEDAAIDAEEQDTGDVDEEIEEEDDDV